MKLNTTIKTLCAAVALATSAAASATPFYLDVGTDYDPTGLHQVTATSTSVKTEAQYKYKSTTSVFDTNGNGLGAGDSILTTIGLNAIGGTWGVRRAGLWCGLRCGLRCGLGCDLLAARVCVPRVEVAVDYA